MQLMIQVSPQELEKPSLSLSLSRERMGAGEVIRCECQWEEGMCSAGEQKLGAKRSSNPNKIKISPHESCEMLLPFLSLVNEMAGPPLVIQSVLICILALFPHILSGADIAEMVTEAEKVFIPCGVCSYYRGHWLLVAYRHENRSANFLFQILN